MEKKEKTQSFAKRDRLLEIEAEARELWQKYNINNRQIDLNKPKYFITFPYPYMNGKLHLGHAYSMSKAEFTARYKTLKGFNVLFPFGFHCTGMPICAAANKLKDEIENTGVEKLREIAKNRGPLKDMKEGEKLTQYEILLGCGVEDADIPSFTDPEFWLSYFPPRAKEDLLKFGVAVDLRRSFITTSVNPYYNSFIEWQFTKLKEKNVIKFGKRPSIYCVKDAQICADHDRSEGEGVVPQEYTLIKLRVCDKRGEQLFKTTESVYLVAATLRPETMYGQTNCFVLPTGVYGVFRMKNDELWVCSEKSMLNMAYQFLTKEFGKYEKVQEVEGDSLLGLECEAPLSFYKKVFVWPMLSISMAKGTGVVTSVPSDAPDDYAVLVELNKKDKLREKYHLTDEMVLPFQPVSIIDVPDYSDLSAVKAYEEFKITSMNDKEKLLKAKEHVYLKGFYAGVMKVGEHVGKKVQDAKALVKKHLIDSNQGATYYEPEKKCVSRSNEECIVALCDQWYINYGKAEHREVLKKFVKSDKFKMFNENLSHAFVESLDWLKEWGCSRSFGLGTVLPWDKSYVIESLSDSTIYMAYYTIAHLLQADISGNTPGSLDIKAEDFSLEDWDYIFLKKGRSETSRIPEEKLATLRENFEYWYPLDLRCSGKDLIKNHLTMSLYNHLYIWGEEMVPRGYFCNGWVMVDGEKMSKSLGNFYTISDFCDRYSSDASRIALATAGDSIDNANLQLNEADNSILKLVNLEDTIKELCANIDTLRTSETNAHLEFYDKVFENKIKEITYLADQFYDGMVMRDVLKEVFYNMSSIREDYKSYCGNLGMRRDLVLKWIETELILLYPIAPHFCDILWKNLFRPLFKNGEKPELVSMTSFPLVKHEDIDFLILKKNAYIEKHGKSLRSTYDKFKSNKKSSSKPINKIYVVVAEAFLDWQIKVLDQLKEHQKIEENTGTSQKADCLLKIKEIFQSDKNLVKKAMAFASFRQKEFQQFGWEVYESEVLFNEKNLIQDNINVFCKEIVDTNLIKIISVIEADQCDNKSVKSSLESCLPGKPLFIIDS
jgi:leucyl-tRNA synthetase